MIRCVKRKTFGGSEQKKAGGAKNRTKNAAAVFEPVKGISLDGLNVILVDDVVTSGASMAVCTRRILSEGAAAVICVGTAMTEKK